MYRGRGQTEISPENGILPNSFSGVPQPAALMSPSPLSDRTTPSTDNKAREWRIAASGQIDDKKAQTLPSHHEPTVQQNQGPEPSATGVSTRMAPERHGFHPVEMLWIVCKSCCRLAALTNLLLPVVPVGIVLGFLSPEWHLAIFITNYLGMVPMANLLAFSSQEVARKLPRIIGVVMETTFASAVEVILCIVLLLKDEYLIIQAALLGSMLANLLLVTGACFIIGGIKYPTQHFDSTTSEVGGALLLISAVGLMIPAAYYESVSSTGRTTLDQLRLDVLAISRGTSILLICSYALYILFQLKTHRSLFDRLLYFSDMRNEDRHENLMRAKLSRLEAIPLVAISLVLVTLHAMFLVDQIHWIVTNKGVSDAFMGLILVPLVEKFAEHLTALDQASDNAMDFALAHILGSTIQTSLLVSPLLILLSWILDKPLDLNFEIFYVIVLVLAVLVVGNFMKDGKSNYLEGALCIVFYGIVGVAVWWYPDPVGMGSDGH